MGNGDNYTIVYVQKRDPRILPYLMHALGFCYIAVIVALIYANSN